MYFTDQSVKFQILFCKLHRYHVMIYNNNMYCVLLSRCVTGVNFMPISLLKAKFETDFVIYRLVCKIHIGRVPMLVTMETYSFVIIYYLAQFHKNWIKKMIILYLWCYPRLTGHLLLPTPQIAPR